MGNEMGNNNTTGLKEEESLTVEDTAKGLSRETCGVDDVKPENHVESPGLEAEDFQEKPKGLASDDDNKTTPNREENELSVEESLSVGPNEEGHESDENQNDSLPNDDDEDEGLIELNMEEIVPSNTQNQAQKEEEGAENSDFDSKSIPSHNLEPEKDESSECDRSELETVLAEPSEPDTKHVTDNGHISDAKFLENLEGISIVSESITEKEIDESVVEQKEAEDEEEKEKELCEEKFEPKNVDKLNTFLAQPNDQIDLGGNNDEVLSTKSESESESEEKSIVVSEETILISLGNGEEEQHDNNPNQTRDSNASQSDSEVSKVSEDHEAQAFISPEFETVPSQSIPSDGSDEEKDSTEKRIVEDETTFGSKNSIAEIIVSMNELSFDSTNVTEKPEAIISDSKASSRASVERFSTDSDHDSVHYTQMRKSPSFSLDLQNEEKSEETEQMPLLYQDKATIETLKSYEESNVNMLTLNGHNDEEEEVLLGVEEKVLRLERSDSEKSKTPFLGGFVKEEEEGNNGVVTVNTKKQSKAQNEAKSGVSSSTKVTISSTSKGKEKRKIKSSLFGNCMCCATVIN